MLIDELRTNKGWYLGINWNKWYHGKLQGWNKEYRRNDILMSAMFLASSGKKIKYNHLIDVLGPPDWASGTRHFGIMYYKMVSNPSYVMGGCTYMSFIIECGFIHSGGSNQRIWFCKGNNYRKICLTSQRRGDPSCAWAPFASLPSGCYATSSASLCR
jgi:hypothetical protein